MAKANQEEFLGLIERRARSRHLPIIGPQKASVLAELIRRIRPKRILEVGTLIGYSAIVIGKELESDAEIITIEIDEDEAKLARENIRLSSIKPRVEVQTGDALELIPRLKGTFDFVFLDAAKHQYLDYLRLVEPLLHKGSMIVADNAQSIIVAAMFSMSKYLKYVRKSGKYDSKLVSLGWDGMEVSTML
jgi:predicted O-methyltransferase YrrM